MAAARANPDYTWHVSYHQWLDPEVCLYPFTHF